MIKFKPPDGFWKTKFHIMEEVRDLEESLIGADLIIKDLREKLKESENYREGLDR